MYEREKGVRGISRSYSVKRLGINCSVIDLKVLSGNIEDISREASSELVGALLQFIQCTNGFKQITSHACAPRAKLSTSTLSISQKKTVPWGDWQHPAPFKNIQQQH